MKTLKELFLNHDVLDEKAALNAVKEWLTQKEAKSDLISQLIKEKAKVWNAHNYKEAERLGQIRYVPINELLEELNI